MKKRTLVQLLAGASLLLASLAPLPAAAEPQAVRATLPNGLQVVVVRDPLAPAVTTVMNYLAGSDEEAITGLAHATEHMMFRGSKTLSASEFADVTAITGGSFNADTQSQITQYYFTMPAQYLDIALQLEASRAHDVLETQKLWNQERGAITQEVTRDNSDAEYRLYVKVLHNIMAGTPYANEGLGTVHSFKDQINSPQLLNYYNTWYHPNNAIMVISGDVDPQTTIDKVKKYFGAIPSATLPARKPVELQPLKTATFRDESDKPYTLAFIGYRFPGYDDPDYAASEVLADVLNSQRADIYGLVASGKALFTQFESENWPKAGMALAAIAVPANARPEDAAQALRAVIDNYKKTGVPADLVEAAKRREVSQAEFKGNSIQGLAFEWSQALAVEKRQSPDDDIAAIQKVTVDDVNRVLRQYLDADTATYAYSVPNNKGGVASGHAGGSESNTVIPTEHKPLPKWASHVLDNLKVPNQTTHPTDMTLPNGIRLIVQPESITHTVVLTGRIKNSTGLQEAPNTEGVATVTENLLPFGTTTYDRLAYQAELDKIAADVDTGTGFSLSVLSKDFDRGVQLLADDELHPSLPEKDFEIVKKQAYDEAVGEEKAPDHIASLAMAKALYPKGDPARRHATPATIKSLTLDQVKEWYTRVYRPDMTTIVVVGDITPEAARATVEKWFGDWHATGAKPVTDPPQVPNNPPASLVVPDPSRIQDQVTMTETLKISRKDRDFAPLEVADTVLSGGFYASLLYHDLREVNGFVYSVGSDFGFGKTRSTFTIDYGAMPEKANRAWRAAIAELRSLQQKTLPDERLKKAKALLLGEIPIQEQSYSGLGNLLLHYATLDLPLNQNLLDARAELAVTPEQLRHAMNKWIRPDGFVRVVLGPAPK